MQILEKTQFLQQINLGAENEQNVNITRYFNPNESKEPLDKENFLKIFHLNISSSPYHCSELHSLLRECNIDFDVIGITESRIKRNQKALSNIEISNYKVEQCSTESANGGALLYVKNDTMYKVRNDLKMYKSKNLESIFIEIINTNNKNIVVGCVYHHPSMDANQFSEHYLSILNEKLLLEKNKEIILMGDFNINLLRYNEDHNSTDFLDQIYSCSLIPRITSPTRVTPRSKTLIDNIFSTDTANEVIAGNILTTLSDHLAQFLLFPIKRTKLESKANNYCRNFKRFDPKIFLHNLQNIDWCTALKPNEENVDDPFDWLFQITETLLDTYAPIEKL